MLFRSSLNLLDERVEEFLLSRDDLEMVVRIAEPARKVVVADCNDADDAVVCAPVRDEVVVLGLVAVEDGLDCVVFGVGPELGVHDVRVWVDDLPGVDWGEWAQSIASSARTG